MEPSSGDSPKNERVIAADPMMQWRGRGVPGWAEGFCPGMSVTAEPVRPTMHDVDRMHAHQTIRVA